MSFNSQMAHARKFMVYMTMLCTIEKSLVYNKDSIIELVKEVLKDEPENCSDVCEWIEFLYGSGQRIEDWDINQFIWIRYDEKFWTNEEKEKLKELNDKIGNCTDEVQKEEYRNQINDINNSKLFEVARLKLIYYDKLKEVCKNNIKYNFMVRQNNW